MGRVDRRPGRVPADDGGGPRPADANVAESVRLSDEGRCEERAQAPLEFHGLLVYAYCNPILIIMMRSVLDLLREVVAAVSPSSERSLGGAGAG